MCDLINVLDILYGGNLHGVNAVQCYSLSNRRKLMKCTIIYINKSSIL